MPEQPPIKRCTTYSRSSVEKDNRDPFDSFSAQFMACAEFIGSQVSRRKFSLCAALLVSPSQTINLVLNRRAARHDCFKGWLFKSQ